jgi:hypothetical protein
VVLYQQPASIEARVKTNQNSENTYCISPTKESENETNEGFRNSIKGIN